MAEHKPQQCRHCGRKMWFPCRNTRDMDRVDGNNQDGACHAALVRLGGGERGRKSVNELNSR